MQLYLIRHAEAEDLGTGGITRDFDRPLTERGRADSRMLAEAFARRNIVIDAVAASPLARAHQTAAEIVSILAPNLRVVTCDELAIDKLKPGKLSEFLADFPASGDRLPSRDEKSVAIVGHMPDLGTYCEWLRRRCGKHPLIEGVRHFHSLQGRPGAGRPALEWLITPEWLE